MDNFQIRTDLALEARESVNEEESKLRGVSVEEHYEEEADLRITKVTICLLYTSDAADEL